MYYINIHLHLFQLIPEQKDVPKNPKQTAEIHFNAETHTQVRCT